MYDGKNYYDFSGVIGYEALSVKILLSSVTNGCMHPLVRQIRLELPSEDNENS